MEPEGSSFPDVNSYSSRITDNHHRTPVNFAIQYTPNPLPPLACKENKKGIYLRKHV